MHLLVRKRVRARQPGSLTFPQNVELHCLRFVPDKTDIPYKLIDTITMIPRYLFRAYSPGSDGINDSMGFCCQAISEECNTIASLKDLERQDARRMLKDHVLWASWKVRQDDILISFSSSFLFTVQHCIRKIEKCYNIT